MAESTDQRYLLAEYNPCSLFYGWHLYERQTNDGRPNDGYDHWGWMRYTDPWSPQAKAQALCRRLGYDSPAVEGRSHHFAEWFARTFPNGILVRLVDSEERYELIELPTSRPRQRRGVIRTIRGAAMADRAVARESEKAAASTGT